MSPADSERLPDLWKATYDLVAQVPEGRVTTYGEVAKALGDIVASRFVGLAMSRNDDIVRVPCRRVVQSDGYVGGYTGGGPRKKIRLLRGEGVEIVGSKIADLPEVLFTDFKTEYPLRALRKRQLALRRRLHLRSNNASTEKVVGIDVAYEGDQSYAASVSFDAKTGFILGSRVVQGRAIFPYVPTYLAFREIPVIHDLMTDVDDATIVMYDGNGILHPEKFGVACQVGVTYGVSTIGIAKKLLCGTVSRHSRRDSAEVRLDGDLIGFALTRESQTNPVFVSPGNKIDCIKALALVKRFLKYRIPEPTRLAHIVAEEARRGTNHK